MSDKLAFIHGLLSRGNGRVARKFADRIRKLPEVQPGEVSLAIRIDALLQVRAGLEAALVLLGYDLPGWSMRSLIQEDGRWHCTLARHPSLPAALDDAVCGSEASPARAILAAMTEARCQDADGATRRRSRSAGAEAVAELTGVGCDDYA